MFFQAVIFDLDGTILNTLGDLHGAMNYALRQNGFEERSLDFIKNAIGNGVRELTRRSLPEHLRRNEAVVDDICAQMKAYYGEHWHDTTKPYEGISELFRFLVQNGISVNVLSNKADPITQKMIPYWYSDIPFDCIFGERPNVPTKPNPTSAKEMAELLRIAPDRILFVGDSSADMLAAKGAGMHSLGVLWGYRDEAVLREAEAEWIAETPQDIIAHIKRYKKELQ